MVIHVIFTTAIYIFLVYIPIQILRRMNLLVWIKLQKSVYLMYDAVLLRVGSTVIMTWKNVQFGGKVLATPTSTDSESSLSGSNVSINL